MFFTLFISCQEGEQEETTATDTVEQTEPAMDTTSAESEELSKDFKKFYNKFHTDSSFQMERIQFPLQGVPENRKMASASFTWKKSDWVMHQPFENIGEKFHRSFQPIGDRIVIEYIFSPQLNMIMERRFQEREDGWYLIYYKALGDREAEVE